MLFEPIDTGPKDSVYRAICFVVYSLPIFNNISMVQCKTAVPPGR